MSDAAGSDGAVREPIHLERDAEAPLGATRVEMCAGVAQGVGLRNSAMLVRIVPLPLAFLFATSLPLLLATLFRPARRVPRRRRSRIPPKRRRPRLSVIEGGRR